jgi:hypothetical protein
VRSSFEWREFAPPVARIFELCATAKFLICNCLSSKVAQVAQRAPYVVERKTADPAGSGLLSNGKIRATLDAQNKSSTGTIKTYRWREARRRWREAKSGQIVAVAVIGGGR